ncbi:MAG: hypothetical protein AABW67_04200 [Nanoarchaeota archaeon]
MKKQNKTKIDITSLMIGICAVIILFISLFSFKDLFEPDYKITKMECHNETNTYQEKYNPREEITDISFTYDMEPHKSYRLTFFEDFSKDDLKYEDYTHKVNNMSIRDISAKYFNKESGKFESYYGLVNSEGKPIEMINFLSDYDIITNPSNEFIRARYNYTVFYTIWEIKEVNETKEVCSQVEIDKSDLKNDYCTGFAELNKVMDVRSSAIQRDKCLNEDITKEWLVDNCDAILNEPSNDDGTSHEGCGYRSSDSKYVCNNHDCKNGEALIDCAKKYKCFEKYEVQIK